MTTVSVSETLLADLGNDVWVAPLAARRLGWRRVYHAALMTADFGARFSHHLVYRSAAHAFQGYHQWSSRGENPDLQRFIERATPRQREVLGFPPPGHEYWTQETLAAVAMRYPKMDSSPYRNAPRSRD